MGFPFFRLLNFIYMSDFLHVRAMCMPGAHRGQKRAYSPLELEMVVSHHGMLGIEP